ncbi:class I SAM-dependent methyltransferase [Phyllobacterium chamaecytisi]|uniref:class I SAM-dependent methyltransferase n=1 Tax=Phyllobacterium chamaecytisi TaxID=2876082 RepID=UPI001CCE6905|nr:class I SAM-dependent methyltransferase [Phyllobacterium sp. KW56]MBZ9600534.1 class I SAM-dependent methyltransferase [Phyllobacterium sp. KW56]
MVATDKVFAGAIPEIYDRLIVPMIFEPYAQDLADRVARFKPENVLEIAAGTGVLTRAMASRLNAETRIVASDLNQPMLDRASARQPEDSRIVWQQADALALPFEPQMFDVVACQFGVMFYPDKVQGHKEAYRVLKPGGHYFFNVWDRLATSDFTQVVTSALEEMFPDDPPRFMARTPHGYWDQKAIRDELSAAGFRSIAIETLEKSSRANSARDAAIAFCQGTPLRNEIEARSPTGLEATTEHVAQALMQRFGSGVIEGRINAHIVAAVR